MESITEPCQPEEILQPKKSHVELWIWSNPEGTERTSKIIEIPEPLTIFTSLKKAKREDGLDFEWEDYPHGKVITSINGRKQSPKDNLYWMIYKIPQCSEFVSLPSDVFLIKQGVEEAVVVDGDVYLLWLKTVQLDTPRNN